MNDSKGLPAAVSMTHQHLLACINTQLAHYPAAGPVRICDVGCGDGRFLSYMVSCLPRLWPDRQFEFYGIDVADAGVQPAGFFARTLDRLSTDHPDRNWDGALKLLTSDQPWPFEDGHLSIVTSNQVLEHVWDHRFFLAEHERVLGAEGFGLHLFPLRECLWEGHIHVPIAHRIREYDRLAAYIRLCSRLGIGKYQAHRAEYGMTLEQYVEEHADYISFMTNYIDGSSLLDLCRNARLRADFRHSEQYLVGKLRSIIRISPSFRYGVSASVFNRLLYLVMRRFTSITLFVQKKQTYAR